jgi:Arm DNA-binding domain
MNTTSLINDAFIGGMTCPLGCKHKEVFDSDLRGFYCDFLISGRKSFRLRYRINGKLRVLTLGDAAYISSDQARAQALKLLSQVKQGIDPSLGKEVHVLGLKLEEFFNQKYYPTSKVINAAGTRTNA